MSHDTPQPFDPIAIELCGTNIVEASAGTGKTYAITTLFVRLLLERGLDPSEILVVTFTDAATAELRDRVRARLLEAEAALCAALAGEAIDDDVLARLASIRKGSLKSDIARLRRALDNIDEAAISTIHGFCQRVLIDNAFGTRVPFGAELCPDLSELTDDVLYDFWHRRVAQAPPGLARQATALGVDIGRLRALFLEARRNPRIGVTPPAPPPGTPGEIEQARGEVLRHLAAFDGFAFVEEHALKADFGSGPALALLLEGARAAVVEDDPAVRHFPAHVERLFPAFVCAHLKQKWAGDPRARHEVFAAFERLVRLSWQPVLGLEHELLGELPEQLFARKLQQGVFGFEDLPLRVADAVRGDTGAELRAALRRRFKAVLIDEFQDTDPVQFEIFQAAFGGSEHPLFLIGDPKQAIYAFRGADVFAYLDAAKGAARFSMGVSYRSDPGLIAAVNQLFLPAGSFLIDGINYSAIQARPGAKNGVVAPHAAPGSDTASLELLFVERSDASAAVKKAVARRTAARVVAADIARLLGEKASILRRGEPVPISATDLAVLTRTNAQSLIVQDALRERGIPSVVIIDESVFVSEEAEDLQAVLGAVLDPGSRLDLRRAVATSLVGVSGDEIAASEGDAGFWHEWATRFRSWHDLWVERGFIRMFRALLADTAAAKRLLERVGGERRLTNVLHLGELLHNAATEKNLGPGALLAWLAEQRAGRGAAVERAEIRLESDDARVKILTVHKAKGLEFPVVYCPFLWDSVGGKMEGPCRFHDASGRAMLDVDVDAERRKANVARAKWEGFAEELRVVYVALTRAQHRTVALWGGFNTAGASAAACLLYPPGALPPPALPEPGRLDKQTDAQLTAPLEAFAARVGESVAVRRVPWSYDAQLAPSPETLGPVLEARKVEHAIRSWRHTSSFSSLTRRELAGQLDADEGRDRDEEEQAVDAGSFLEAAGAGVDDVASSVGTPSGLTRITLDGFPRGRRTGDLFHDLLEHIDFASVTDAELTELADAKLDGYGLSRSFAAAEGAERRGQLVRAIRETLVTPLSDGGPCLRDITPEHKFAELEFRMPVGAETSSLTRKALARAFREHPSDAPAGALPRSYAERVEQLGFRALSGFLKGYIDLVFEHAGRWYVVDYKTNHLGDHWDDYRTPAMIDALGHSHYFLQYHLYALALHRHLRHFQRGYSYAEHFGGVFYLFVKGMHPDAAAGNGVFFEKPPLARLEALSSAIAGRARDALEQGGAA